MVYHGHFFFSIIDKEHPPAQVSVNQSDHPAQVKLAKKPVPVLKKKEGGGEGGCLAETKN